MPFLGIYQAYKENWKQRPLQDFLDHFELKFEALNKDRNNKTNIVIPIIQSNKVENLVLSNWTAPNLFVPHP